MHIFRRIFLSNYWWQKSDIWSQASYRYPISWEAFFDPSDSYFLFAKERGYHKWALAHSSSCFCYSINSLRSVNIIIEFYSTLLFFSSFFFLCAWGRIGTRFLRPGGTSPLKGVNPAGTPGYRNGTESFFVLKGRPSVVRDVEIHNQPVLRMRHK